MLSGHLLVVEIALTPAADCRWVDTRSGMLVAAKCLSAHNAIQAEVRALQAANRMGISRVVDLLDIVSGPFGKTHLVLE